MATRPALHPHSPSSASAHCPPPWPSPPYPRGLGRPRTRWPPPRAGPRTRNLHRNRYPVRGTPCEQKGASRKVGFGGDPNKVPARGRAFRPAALLPRPSQSARPSGAGGEAGTCSPRHAARPIGARAAGLGANIPQWLKNRCASRGGRDAHQRARYRSLRGRRALPRGSCARA